MRASGNNNGNLLGLLIILLFLWSCGNSLPKEEYIKWVEDEKNRLHLSKTVEEYKIEVQYEPKDYKWLLSGEHQGREVDSMQYYQLTIERVDKLELLLGSNPDRQANLYYFSYRFEHDISLEEAGHSLPCLLFHLESSGSTSRKRFLLGFKEDKNEQQISTLVINSEWFGSLPIRFKIDKENIPTLLL
jgi:hypothetical protein